MTVSVILGSCVSQPGSAANQPATPATTGSPPVLSSGPPVRAFASIAYDAARREVVVFGGLGADATANSNGTVYDETWAWNGRQWSERFPAIRPPARVGASMVYDTKRRVLVLFGGWEDLQTGRGLNDTWTWDGTRWMKQHPLTAPQPRGFAAMAYDAGRHVAVMFGGHQGSGTPEPAYHETWTWDGANWSRQHPLHSPSARYQPAMTYDAADGQTVLFGGISGPLPSGEGFTDTWTWDGRDWTEQHPAASPPGLGIMVYDSARRKVLLTASSADAAYLFVNWIWDGSTWTRRGSQGYAVAGGAADDTARGVVVFMYFGYTDRDQVEAWIWTGQAWLVEAIWRQPTVLVKYPTALAAGIAGVEARTGFAYAGGACSAGQPCLASAQVFGSADPTTGLNAAYVRVTTSGFWPGFTCYAYVHYESDAAFHPATVPTVYAWHFQLPVVCSQQSGYNPVLGAQDHVHTPGSCANVREGPGLSFRVLSCVPDGTVVRIDTVFPRYADGHIWWSINHQQGWMAHDSLVTT